MATSSGARASARVPYSSGCLVVSPFGTRGF
jgi:hypothetical protein